MYQPPEPATYIPAATGFGIRHGLPEFTFQETPLGLSSRRVGSGSGGGGGSISGGSGSGFGLGSPGTVGADNINSGASAGTFYAAPIYSANTAALGPAPGILSNFPFHFNSEFHHDDNPRSRIKMEMNPDDIAAQEAAARDYQSRTMVRIHRLSFMLISKRMRNEDENGRGGRLCFPSSYSSCPLTLNHDYYSRASSRHVIPIYSNLFTNIPDLRGPTKPPVPPVLARLARSLAQIESQTR